MKRDVLAFIRFIWKSNRALIIFGMIFVATVQLLLIYLNSTLDIAPMVEVFLSQLPPQMTEMFGEQILSQITIEGTVAFGLEHPLVITVFTFISISMVSNNIASGSGNMMMEVILAHPFRRLTLLNSLYFFTMLMLGLIIISAFIGSFAAVYLFHEIDSNMLFHMIQADINAFLLHVFILSYTLFFSVYFKDVNKAVRVSAIITLVFYFLEVLSELWEALHFTTYFNFFSYLEPSKIMVSYDKVYSDMAFLTIWSVIIYFASRRIFLRKDIL
jgi:ABC-2 type transport system permease protein